MADKDGLTTLIVEVEGKSGLGAAFGRATREDEESPPPGGTAALTCRLTLTPDYAIIGT